jgi:hypothetical protein
MIGRLVHMLVVVVACFSVGTVLSAVGMGGYLAVKWDVNRAKLMQMLAVAQGIPLPTAPVKPAEAPAPDSQDQASYEEVLEARAEKFRNLELREQALRGSLDQMRYEQGRLAEEKAVVDKSRQSLQAQLTQIDKEATDAGWEQNRVSLQTIRPKQAKELLLAMMAKNEMDDVVALLAPMNDSKLAKIIGEFKTPEETQKIDEVLRLIRRGVPRTTAAANTRQQLGAAQAAAGPEGGTR